VKCWPLGHDEVVYSYALLYAAVSVQAACVAMLRMRCDRGLEGDDPQDLLPFQVV